MKGISGYILMLCIGLAAFSAGAITPSRAFVTAPRDVIAAIDSITRLDMLDYYASGSSVASRNAFGGESIVKNLSDDAITVSTSGSSEVTILPIAMKSDTLILVINTLALPAPDSQARLFDSNWNELKNCPPNHNDLKLWTLPNAKEQKELLENTIPFIPAIYNYSNGIITMTNTLRKILSTDDYAAVKDYIKPTVSYRWSGGKWKLVK